VRALPRLVALLSVLVVVAAGAWWIERQPPPAAPDLRPLRVVDPPMPRLPWLGAYPQSFRDRAVALTPQLPVVEVVPRSRPTPELPAEPLPPRPLPGRAPAPELLASVVDRLAPARRSLRLGPYAATTDVEDLALLERLDALAGDVERAYAERYGATPIGEPREAIVVFRDRDGYARLAREDARIATIDSDGHTVHGMVMLYAGDRPPSEVGATLVHELVHVLNRRALGPALPPWLDEGMAEDLGQSRVLAGGRLDPGTLGGESYDRGDHIELRGGLAAALVLQEAIGRGEAPRVEALLASPWEDFVAAGRGRYDAACFFVRYLLDGEGAALRPAFQDYLKSIAEGGPADGEDLRRRLDRPWPFLDLGWHAWMQGIDVRALAGQVASEAAGPSGSTSRQASPPSP
jgi:hypothetical protein